MKKIFFLIFVLSANLIESCPTSLGKDLLVVNEISYRDIKNLNLNNLDYKLTGA